jgi:predicted transcriptional regulator
MSKRDPVYPIYSKKELSALASFARIEIIDVLAQMGTVSVAELAATLGRAADTLYYHLRILQKAGLVVDCGSRVTQGRSEALYRARNLIIDYENARQKNARNLTAVASSILRLGIRDFKEAVQNDEIVVAGAHRELWSARKAALLTKKQVGEVNELIWKLLNSVSTGPEGGQLYGITILLTPLNRQRRTGSKKRSGQKKAGG